MPHFHRAAALTIALALVALACGGSDGSRSSADPASDDWDAPLVVSESEIVPQIVSSDLAQGEPTRLLFGLLDDQGEPIADPDLDVKVALYDIADSDGDDGEEPKAPVWEKDATFFWAVPDTRGLYEVDEITFDHAGVWGIEVTARDETVRVKFDVKAEARGVAVGDPVPDTPTRTAAEVGGNLALITTDDDPDPALYEISVPAAVAVGKPFVVVLGTPKFCSSGTCGPSLDVVKGIRSGYPGINFVHVEIYENLDTPKPTLSPVVDAWHLPTEPWVYVVGSDGNVYRRFEGAISERTIRNALDHVS